MLQIMHLFIYSVPEYIWRLLFNCNDERVRCLRRIIISALLRWLARVL